MDFHYRHPIDPFNNRIYFTDHQSDVPSPPPQLHHFANFSMSASPSRVTRARVVIIGDSAVGKTSLLNRLLENRFDSSERSTVGVNWQLWRQELPDSSVELQIWDTAGQETFRALTPLYYRGSTAAVLVYDSTNINSFENLPVWISTYLDVAPKGVITVAGNKCDADAAQLVSFNSATEWANKMGYRLFETSAKTGRNVRELFGAVAEQIKDRPIQPEVVKAPVVVEVDEESKCC
jgi:small GTP-binding protein